MVSSVTLYLSPHSTMAICPICHRDHAGDAAEATAQEKKRKEEEGVLADPAPKAITEVGGKQMNVKRPKTFSFSFNEDPILISHEKALKSLHSLCRWSSKRWRTLAQAPSE